MTLLDPPVTILRLLHESLPQDKATATDAAAAAAAAAAADTADDEEVLSYVTFLAAGLAEANEFDPTIWKHVLTPYLQREESALSSSTTTTTSRLPPSMEDAETVVETFRQATERAYIRIDDEESVGGEDEEGVEEVCDLRFNLAYGGKILLHQTKLRLLRGHRYALVGQNGVGKTTLMNAINSGKLEGWPAHLVTAYVDSGSNVDPQHEALIVISYILDSCPDRTEAECVSKLQELDFTDEMIHGTIGALSGGWQMKMRLIRAV